jgi:hypothetical protein
MCVVSYSFLQRLSTSIVPIVRETGNVQGIMCFGITGTQLFQTSIRRTEGETLIAKALSENIRSVQERKKSLI